MAVEHRRSPRGRSAAAGDAPPVAAVAAAGGAALARQPAKRPQDERRWNARGGAGAARALGRAHDGREREPAHGANSCDGSGRGWRAAGAARGGRYAVRRGRRSLPGRAKRGGSSLQRVAGAVVAGSIMMRPPRRQRKPRLVHTRRCRNAWGQMFRPAVRSTSACPNPHAHRPDRPPSALLVTRSLGRLDGLHVSALAASAGIERRASPEAK
jgi:hypothetical protein